MKLSENLFLDQIEVVVSGDFTPGRRTAYSEGMEQWYPGWPPEVENVTVVWRGLDITKQLKDDELEYLKEQILDGFSEEELYV